VALPALTLVFAFGVLSAELALWFFPLLICEHLSQEASVSLIALGRPVQSNVVLFVRSAAWVYPVLALAVLDWGKRDIRMILLPWLIGTLLSLVVAAFILRDLPWRQSFDQKIEWDRIRAGLRVAAPFIVTTGSSLGLLFFDRFVVEMYQGLSAVGIYTFFGSITSALHTLVNSGVSATRVPQLVRAYSEGSPDEFRAQLKIMARLTGASTVLLGAFLVLAIFPLLHIVGKPQYMAEVSVFLMLVVAAATRCLADIPTYALYAKSCDKMILLANVAGFGVSLLLNFALVPVLSIKGAGIAAIAGAMTLFTIASVANGRTAKRIAGDQRSELPTLAAISND
jgi:O-antigen/teichoic acid export membrane protein